MMAWRDLTDHEKESFIADLVALMIVLAGCAFFILSSFLYDYWQAR